MPVTPNKKVEIEQRRQQVAELYVQGHTQASIATRLAIKQPTVCEDLKRIRQQWRVSTVRDFDAACDLELQKLDRVEREAWDAYERSQKPAQSAVITEGAEGRTRKSIKNQNGDLHALDIVLKCCADRRALLGLNAPTRIAPVMPDGMAPFRLAVEKLSVEEMRVIQRLHDRRTVVAQGGANGEAEEDSGG
ncbi:MAG TPA: hypothetical protein VHX86_14570 [Tepidisphaeraceae bacterium]|jgi:hypothetical protein|nr:hypothetical protein [Tepidisphaeraceae bacterium]